MEGIITIGCIMDFTKYPYDSHRCQFLMGSTGFSDQLMRFDGKFSYSESGQRPLQYTVRFFMIEFKVMIVHVMIMNFRFLSKN